MIVCVDPLLLVTAQGIVFVTGFSSLKPPAKGVTNTVCAPVVIASAITPEPGVGSVVSLLPASDVLAEALEYNLTHAAADV